MDSIYLRNLTTHNILMQIFKLISWWTLCKQPPKMFNGINFKKLDPALNNIFTKPNSLGLIVLNTRSELGWQSSIQYQITYILIMNRKIHRCITHCQTNCLTKGSCNVDNVKKVAATLSHRYYLCLHS